jgi:hypothetical protein
MSYLKTLVVLSVVLSGCATTTSDERMLNSLVGSNVDNLLMVWGPPANTYPLSNGGQVLEYNSRRNFQFGGYPTTVPQTTYGSGTADMHGTGGSASGTYSGTTLTYVQKTTPSLNIPLQCVTRFTVNAQRMITNWAWQGNRCAATEPK